MTDWKTVQGSQDARPEEFDTTSSAVVVYQRRNVERVTVESDGMGTVELWQYKERQMSYAEYSMMQLEQNRADIDYISMMTGINLSNIEQER